MSRRATRRSGGASKPARGCTLTERRVRISLSLSIAVLLAAGPASAKPSLERAAKVLCHGDTTGFDLGEMLSQARGRAIAPLLRAVASLETDDECDQDPLALLVDLLCEAQGAVAGNRVTPAFAPVRAALTSGDPRRESAALDVLSSLNGVRDFDPGIESVEPSGGGPRCDYKKPIVAAAVAPLARLLERTRGARRAEALNVIAQLDLQEMGAPFVPALVRLLDDRDSRDRAVVLLATIGKPAAAAAPRLGRLLAAATEPAAASIHASALTAIGAPSAAAAAALPALLDEALPGICEVGPPPLYPVLFRAARAAGPPPAVARDRWAASLVARAQAALTRVAPPCAHPEVAQELILQLAKLPPSAAQRDVLEAQMMDQQAGQERRFFAAWALRSVGAHLSPPSAAVQAEFFGSPDQPPPPLPERADVLSPLSKAALVAGMSAVRPQVAACYRRYQVPGIALVNVEIAPWGRVNRATVTGMFAGTSAGACVEQAVKTARFPVSEGLMTPYPFQLR